MANMPTARTTKKPTTKLSSNPVKKAAPKSAKAAAGRMTLAQVMAALEKAGSEQTRKTYARHGVTVPMFGVSFATLKLLVKQIGVDHELALALWNTGNHDARTLAIKIADPAKVSAADLDRWARGMRVRSCGAYVPALASESPHGPAKAREWLASKEEPVRCAGWALAGFLTHADEGASDAWFLELVERIAKTIHQAPNDERYSMNGALIALGGRSAALRKAATAAAKKIGVVEVDHGDTSCKTPDAGPYIEKMWAHAAAKKFASPAAQERARESMRTRC
ncbi:MAG: DNA alkylation repair protein [Planctomycetota bacterium]|nr:MAG: DNA alkylation repair protein [Planctomycetota bacterium]